MGARDSIEARASRALQVLQNPEFVAAFDKRREDVISAMERLALDGSAQSEAQAVELVRELQAGNKFKAEFVRLIQANDRQARRVERNEAPKTFDPTALKPNEKGDSE